MSVVHCCSLVRSYQRAAKQSDVLHRVRCYKRYCSYERTVSAAKEMISKYYAIRYEQGARYPVHIRIHVLLEKHFVTIIFYKEHFRTVKYTLVQY